MLNVYGGFQRGEKKPMLHLLTNAWIIWAINKAKIDLFRMCSFLLTRFYNFIKSLINKRGK